jgi:hypothetical protein
MSRSNSGRSRSHREPYATLNLVNTLLTFRVRRQLGQLITSFSKLTSMLSNVRPTKVRVSGCTVQGLRFYAAMPIGLYSGGLRYTVTAKRRARFDLSS